MTETTTPLVVRSYLAQLDAALEGIPDATARDIRAGIAEELTGLDAPTAAVRIEQLGDPFFIAAEAREADREPDREHNSAERLTARAVAPHRPETPARVDGPGYVVVASLLVALGGMVIPVLGWIAGMVMVLVSGAWSRAEKWAAVLAPVCALVLTAGILAAIDAAEQAIPESAPSGNGFHGPTIEDFNPLIPAWYDILWSSALVLILVNFVVGLTLLVRAQRRRRTEPPLRETAHG